MSAALRATRDGLVGALEEIVGAPHVLAGARIPESDTHDESLTGVPAAPLAVVRPATTDEVSRILALAHAERLALVVRGAGTGLSGGATPVREGVVVALDRMDRVLDVDEKNHVAVAQAGVTLGALDRALAPRGLLYPVSPGEAGASLGGTVATNAGGMRAVRYGVTRHHVLGLELVLPGGDVLRTGGRYVKSSSGYDLTQLVVGSEGTLAVVTEVVVKLVPRLPHAATLLAPFRDLAALTAAVAPILAGGLAPLVVEYVDALAMDGITGAAGLDLGIPADMRAAASAYLVVVLEGADGDRVDADAADAGETLSALGALDVFVLPPGAGTALVTARERAFFAAKAAGADDIVDAVVPRAAIATFLADAARLASEDGTLVTACGHIGDGNVHLSVFQPDVPARRRFLRAVLAAAVGHGGAVSGEHGIGTAKQGDFVALEDPRKLALMRRIKHAFDPNGILGPQRLFSGDPRSGAVP